MVIQRAASSSALMSTPRAKNKGSPAKVCESPCDTEALQEQFCPWVRHCPNFASAGHMSNVYRTGLQRLTQHLLDHPEDILPTWSSVEIGNLKTASADTDAWNRTVCNVNRLPKYWMAKFLSETDPSAKPLTTELLKLIDDCDTSAVPRLFSFSLQLPESAPLPKLMRSSKLVCWKVFQQRMTEVGNPIEGFAAKFVDPRTGRIDWRQGGCYTFRGDEAGKAEVIKYLDRVEVALAVPVGRDYELVNPWDVSGAMVCKKPSKVMCYEFFNEGTGPFLVMDKKAQNLERIAAEITAQINDKVNDLKIEEAAPDEAEFMGQNLKDERTRRLQEAQSRARDSAKRRRRVAIT